MSSVTRFLWSASRSEFGCTLPDPPETVTMRLAWAIQENDEFAGKVVNNGFKIWRKRDYAQSRNTFAPILYGVVGPAQDGSRVDGHFQLNPVMRLFLIVWFLGTTIIAAIFLAGGLLSATPESTAVDALPYTVPALLPLIGWALLSWQQQRGRADEEAIRGWVEQACRERTE
jgi:hypothetical protein